MLQTIDAGSRVEFQQNVNTLQNMLVFFRVCFPYEVCSVVLATLSNIWQRDMVWEKETQCYNDLWNE